MTDNYKLYRDFIRSFGMPESGGDHDRYFVVELMCQDNRHFRNYYIHSLSDLDRYEEEIRSVCSLLALSAYGSVSYRLLSQVARDFGGASSPDGMLWLMDVDGPRPVTDAVRSFVNIQESAYDENVVWEFPTPGGTQLVCRPFNLQQFSRTFPGIFGEVFGAVPEVKKNSPALIYGNPR